MGKGPLLGHGARADVYAWGAGKAIKLFWEGTDPEGVAGEAAATKFIHDAGLAGGAGLAVPDCFGTVTVDGRPGIIYERIEGPTMSEQGLARPWLLSRLGRQAAELHAAMHEIMVPGVCPAQRPALELRLRTVQQLPDDVRDAAIRTLAQLPDDSRLCHGDFHPGNILLGPEGPVVIDWPDVKRGSATADVARTVLLLRGAPRHGSSPLQKHLLHLVVRAFLHSYLRHYSRLRPLPWAEMRAWQPVLAAARLAENIECEGDWLAGLASTLVAQARRG